MKTETYIILDSEEKVTVIIPDGRKISFMHHDWAFDIGYLGGILGWCPEKEKAK
jgi:hypothetical protein